MIRKVLVANRGEIAVRVLRACREMGIRTVAVYSEADRANLHVQMADEAVAIGPPPAVESYLSMDRLLEAAHRTKCQAIHPGYGFLAENASFARRCEQEKITFVGPNSRALELVGDKIRARQTMEKAGVPIIPGMKSASKKLEEFIEAGRRIGYPVIVKASAGGGGKGMRIVREEKDLAPALDAGRREAASAFGDETVYLERYIEEPRHVEFQVLCDDAGNIVHLFERECSIQRRHQKLVEETPSTALDPELRNRMGETAKKVMRAAGYTNAGTVEFLLDKSGSFYFLEVNARLQVEHPITELVTGVDLVRQQILIASGEQLPFTQNDMRQRGHALECRIYAEDPSNNFLPSPGKILFLKEPSGPGVRLDSGIYGGWEVPIYYDPILAKLIVWAETRELSCKRMAAALEDYAVLGIRTTIPFLRDIVRHPEFAAGRTTTAFIGQHFDGWREDTEDPEARHAVLAVAALSEMQQKRPGARGAHGAVRSDEPSPWQSLGGWQIGRTESHGV